MLGNLFLHYAFDVWIERAAPGAGDWPAGVREKEKVNKRRNAAAYFFAIKDSPERWYSPMSYYATLS
ncbi:hypothetical protein Ms3S1_p20650 (plasmid) [Methylosinus sp. 3S-1]